ncbi:SusC/RagA family TonB-linked outer membrane protein [Pedobacter alluvionis]|uniref:SusC/RagA family TonB-linked outer membrane protein n=1 Tax=Pedobacter alluvionis TaxID=475253 RepID=A0A497Y3C4_9SPHI|nr:SusC/RagA family TonB-linked outer membrane protein [Pedobacter alluvionis]RLJ77371.1 TonB-linked SusC/RagA family outer membrane protein [Pedobacter alluvionis]TFB33410.1 SusC/RagA family TonB-linked outer membrane protein [Pedobacter alluvionis]
MKKSTIYIVMAMLCFFLKVEAQVKKIAIKGRITNEKGLPIANATIKVKESKTTTIANGEGLFELNNVQLGTTLIISSIGYKTTELQNIQKDEFLNVRMLTEDNGLEEVQVVSTGYQNIPKERATGSFVQLENKTLNRNVGVNILDRLDGVSSGLILNKGLTNGANNPKISIRGRSTLFASAEPTIVLDGFPYEGSIEQINPADILSITLLKDAAAASIWGAKASNGVIVITTKRGGKNQKLQVELSSTLTIGGKPNLYYQDQMSSSEFIDLEEYLYAKGYYTSAINSGYRPVSEAIEIFNNRKLGKISKVDSTNSINNLKERDVRIDLKRYFYRPSVYQQYQLNLNGGGEFNRYYLSGGYDKNMETSVSNAFDRFTLKANNTFSLFKDHLEIVGDIGFASGNTYSASQPYLPYSPYDQIVSANGEPLSVIKNLRSAYVDTVGNGKLLDWHYKPIDELKANSVLKQVQYKINLGINYNILEELTLSAKYQYLKESNSNENNYPQQSFYTRDLINRYSSIVGNTLNRPIPLGGILENSVRNLISKILRFQLDYHKSFGSEHDINAIIGFEGGDTRGNSTSQSYFGYNPETLTNGNGTINPLIFYPYYYAPSTSQQIPTAPSLGSQTDITQSYYTNISYTYKKKYIISGSARRDESNLFGVKANQKGVPLWSTGLAWIIDKENFLNSEWISSLKLRATFGYNGNLDKNISGLLTLTNTGSINEWGSNYSRVRNPPNPFLRWEKVKTYNLGLDYVVLKNRISGSIDFYQKDAEDLIGNNPIAMQSGVFQFKGNGASLRTKGIDLILNIKNIEGAFQWSTAALFNYNTDKVTSYKIKQTSNGNIISGNYNNPLEGYPYYAIFSYPSAGLDNSGAPQGYLNGAISKNYSEIISLLDTKQLKFHGSASPKFFGSIINTFSYKNLELSFNVIYKLGYYFRKLSVFSGSNNYSYTSRDYSQRWQKSGDELSTKIPALTYPANGAMDSFFLNSEDLVDRADHIRLQDIRLSYHLTGQKISSFLFKNASFFLYAKNLGILWKTNELSIDPDYGTFNIPQPFSGTVGFNLKF